MLKKISPFSFTHRTGMILLGLWLLTLLLVSGYTIKLLLDEEQINAKAQEQDHTHDLALLAEQVEQTLRAAMRRPIGALKNLTPEKLDTIRMDALRTAFPYVRLVLLLNQDIKVIRTFPPEQQEHLGLMLAERVQMEHLTSHVEAFGIRIFIESLEEQTMVLALGSISDVSTISGWWLLGFDLKDLLKQQVYPLLSTFGNSEQGTVTLLQPDDNWNDATIKVPINRILPGYFLSFQSADIEDDGTFIIRKVLILSLSLAVLLAFALASWSVFREVWRTHALAELRQRFVANVSHELKTPLALIRMYAETLYLGRISDPERINEYHRVILHEAERLSEMIHNVLTFARLGQQECVYRPRLDDLAQTVTEVLADMQHNFTGRGLTLRSELATDLPLLPHEREGVTRILWNLLDNATKYANASGAEVRLYQVGTKVRLEVIDHGPGIPVAERARLLRPFERGWDTAATGGSGLGLALVAQVAEVHRATFSLESGADGGLCARVDFPIPEVT